MRTAAGLAALLGGLCWIAAYAVDSGPGGGAVDVLTWTGGVLVALAVLGSGAGLVSRSATWLRVVVAVCFLALVGSVVQVLRDGGDPQGVDAVVGAVAVVAAVLWLVRERRAAARAEPRARAGRGSHAR